MPVIGMKEMSSAKHEQLRPRPDSPENCDNIIAEGIVNTSQICYKLVILLIKFPFPLVTYHYHLITVKSMFIIV